MTLKVGRRVDNNPYQNSKGYSVESSSNEKGSGVLQPSFTLILLSRR